MNMSGNRGRDGGRERFTLIELLVVVAILFVLLAMLLPVLGRAKEQAKRTLCIGNLRQIGGGVALYAEDTDGETPHGGAWIHWERAMLYIMHQTSWGGYGGNQDRPVNLGLLIAGDYLGEWQDDRVFRCPSLDGVNDSRGDPSHPNYFASTSVGTWVNSRADYLRNDLSAFPFVDHHAALF